MTVSQKSVLETEAKVRLYLEENAFAPKKPAHVPFQGKDGQRRNDQHKAVWKTDYTEQTICDYTDVIIEPRRGDDCNEEVYKKRVHARHNKEFKAFAVTFDIDPPIRKTQSQQAPSARHQYKRTGGNPLYDGRDSKV
jgi:hypothetical protein